MKELLSHAKINIGLRVVGLRPDGYHNLESIFQEITLSDRIRLTRRERGIKIRCNWPGVPVDERNTCYRAYQVFGTVFGIKDGVEIDIHKNIPPGAGLGGGSSNAATVLKALTQLYGIELSRGQLLKLAARVGSDVPFFVVGKTALVKGRGEVVIPCQFFSAYRVLLIYPNLPVSTAEVFKKFDIRLTNYKADIKFEAFVKEIHSLSQFKEYFFNDLERVVFARYPKLREVKTRLEEVGAEFVSMSGSGSAIYGLFEKTVEMDALRRELEKENQVFIAEPVHSNWGVAKR